MLGSERGFVNYYYYGCELFLLSPNYLLIKNSNFLLGRELLFTLLCIRQKLIKIHFFSGTEGTTMIKKSRPIQGYSPKSKL